MTEIEEIRALLKGWQNYLKNPPSTVSEQFNAGVRSCAESLAAILEPEKGGKDGNN